MAATGLRPNSPEHQRFLDECKAVYEKDQAKMAVDKTNPKEILGASKPMLGLIPPVAELWEAKAFEFGAHGRDANGKQVRAKGYGEYNWRETKIRVMVYVHAMRRHLANFVDGEDVALDSLVKHLGHIRACAGILLDAEECGTLIDDRPKKGRAGDLIERMTVKKPVEVEADFQKAYTTLLQEMENDTNELFAAPSKRRGKGSGEVQAHNHGRRRKPRQ